MNNERKKIVAISGSTRENSTNESILKAIYDLYSDTLDIEIYSNISDLPHFNPDLDNENVPAVIKDFRALIDNSDGVIICTPEYVFSLPGSLKNAIEWTVSTTIFSDKPLAVIVASSLGEKAYESLILIMNTLQVRLGERSKLLIKGARSKFNDKGQITDKNTFEEIDILIKSFIESIDANKANVAVGI